MLLAFGNLGHLSGVSPGGGQFYSLTASAGSSEAGGYGLLIDLVMTVLAALVGGIIANRLKLPVITGYLLAGVAVGPFTPGPVSDLGRVQTLAELGVALLMFALGTQFSLHELKEVGRGAVVGGLLQILLTLALGVPIGMFGLGLPFNQSLYLGGMLAISSSIVMLKLLLSRGEVESLQGRLALGVGIVQDISVVVLAVVLPAIAATSSTGSGGFLELASNIGLELLKALIFLGGAYLLGTRLIPWLLYRIIGTGLRELFLLSILTIAVGTALLAQFIGVSFALGAFLAGMIVSESDAADQVLNEIIPLRDVFATLFFVSIGMLINPLLVWQNLGEILLIVVAILVGKFLIAGLMLRLLGYTLPMALKAGLLLAQIGEFSFVLARSGVERGAINEHLEAVVLAAALVTIVLNPVLYQLFPRLELAWGNRWANNRLARFFSEIKGKVSLRSGKNRPVAVATQLQSETAFAGPPDLLQEPASYDWPGRNPYLDGLVAPQIKLADRRSPQERWPYKRHVVVCGYGRVGRELVGAVRKRNLDVVVIEYDPRRAQEASQRGLVVIQGDATQEYVLKQAQLGEAKVLAITTPDLATAEAITRAGCRLNSRLEIITRSSDPRAIRALQQAGASGVVQPEIEAGLEFIRRTLRAYGVGGIELQALLNGRRERHYGTPRHQ